MRKRISRKDFQFITKGSGQYKVIYTDSETGKVWTARITDMEIIDAIKRTDKIKIKDLYTLKYMVKHYAELINKN
jgi:hypothetical protein